MIYNTHLDSIKIIFDENKVEDIKDNDIVLDKKLSD